MKSLNHWSYREQPALAWNQTNGFHAVTSHFCGKCVAAILWPSWIWMDIDGYGISQVRFGYDLDYSMGYI